MAHATTISFLQRPDVRPAVVLNTVAGDDRAGSIFATPAVNEGRLSAEQ
jgi:hypothetical protein